MEMSKVKKAMIICLSLVLLACLIATGFIPVKYAVYADKDDERRYTQYGGERSLGYWYNQKKANNIRIVELSSENRRAKWKRSGTNYIGEFEEYYSDSTYYEAWWNDPTWWLNSNFNPKDTQNCFVIMYTDLYGKTEKDGYCILPIVIDNWTPTYPIRRSGWIESLLLPDDRLVIWDFIGWRACW